MARARGARKREERLQRPRATSLTSAPASPATDDRRGIFRGDGRLATDIHEEGRPERR